MENEQRMVDNTQNGGQGRVATRQQKGFWSRLRLTEEIEGYLMILPWLIGFPLFTAGPMLTGLGLVFAHYDILSPPRWAGLANLQRLLRDDLVMVATLNTFVLTILSVLPRLVIALLLALLLNQKLRGIGLFRTIYYTPTIVPAFASVVLWILLLQKDAGAVNYGLRSIGLPALGWLTDPVTAKFAIALMTIFYFGPQMLVFLAALQGVPLQLYESAMVDGAGSLTRFWTITLPLITPAIFFNMVVLIVETLQIFTPPFLSTMGGPMNSTTTSVMYIYEQGFGSLRMGYASALSWLLFLLILLFTTLQFRLSGWVHYESN
ncbi:MAG: sugar ABC transporter permease [Chloroflexi bacterium]|nr:MAG: sugar ABC transporter permease [Chloroflexota bacterium]